MNNLSMDHIKCPVCRQEADIVPNEYGLDIWGCPIGHNILKHPKFGYYVTNLGDLCPRCAASLLVSEQGSFCLSCLYPAKRDTAKPETKEPAKPSPEKPESTEGVLYSIEVNTDYYDKRYRFRSMFNCCVGSWRVSKDAAVKAGEAHARALRWLLAKEIEL